jgi:hypothetical protein
MASPIGTNFVNSVSRRYIMPTVVDNVYNSNALTYRILRRKKKMIDGGLQIEIPIAWSHFAAGGYYSGFDLLDVTPSDTVKNAAFDWKQIFVPVSVDGATLVRANSPEAVVNFLGQYFAQAQSEAEDLLGIGMFANSQLNPKLLDGAVMAIDNGAVATTYGGLSRSANTFWSAQVGTAVAPLTFPQMQVIFGNATEGGQRPTIIVTTQAVYNIVWALSTGVNSTSGVPGQAFPAMAGGEDVQLAQAGFSNILFNGVPLLVDSHCPPGNMFMINEEYLYLYVQPQRDFFIRDFDAPVDQDAYTSLILWMGNVCFSNVLRQGLLKQIVA